LGRVCCTCGAGDRDTRRNGIGGGDVFGVAGKGGLATNCVSCYSCMVSITNGHLLFVMGALILQRAQKCEVRQVTKDVVKSEV